MTMPPHRRGLRPPRRAAWPQPDRRFARISVLAADVGACRRPLPGKGESVEDLNQVAALGLVKAVDRYDPELERLRELRRPDHHRRDQAALPRPHVDPARPAPRPGRAQQGARGPQGPVTDDAGPTAHRRRDRRVRTPERGRGTKIWSSRPWTASPPSPWTPNCPAGTTVSATVCAGRARHRIRPGHRSRVGEPARTNSPSANGPSSTCASSRAYAELHRRPARHLTDACWRSLSDCCATLREQVLLMRPRACPGVRAGMTPGTCPGVTPSGRSEASSLPNPPGSGWPAGHPLLNYLGGSDPNKFLAPTGWGPSGICVGPYCRASPPEPREYRAEDSPAAPRDHFRDGAQFDVRVLRDFPEYGPALVGRHPGAGDHHADGLVHRGVRGDGLLQLVDFFPQLDDPVRRVGRRGSRLPAARRTVRRLPNGRLTSSSPPGPGSWRRKPSSLESIVATRPLRCQRGPRPYTAPSPPPATRPGSPPPRPASAGCGGP